ncbi:MAG: Tetratricopeptide repeat [Candidatus Sumerlaeota bacterium]|nr:Tetratricopeptide repeat [Candidatus Sumerlaeota bacterium]
MKRAALAAIVVSLLLLAAPLGAVGLRDEFARLMDEGVAAYESGDYEAALSSFQDAEMMKPESYEAAMNAGLAYAHLGDYEPAVQRFRKAEELAVQEPVKRSWALYNKGRFLFQTVQHSFEQLKGQKEEDSESKIDPERLLGRAVWCLDTFDEALDANPQNIEAQFNRAQAQHLIDELAQYLKKPPQQSGGGQQEQQDSDEQSDEQQDQNNQDQGNQGQNSENQQDQQQNQQKSGDSGDSSQDNAEPQDQQNDNAGQPQGNDDQMEGNADSGNGDQQEEQEQTAEDQQGEEERQDESAGDEEEQSQGAEDASGDEGEGAQAQAAQMPEQMSEKEARALLNLLGNEQVLKMRMPGMGNRPAPEKDW